MNARSTPSCKMRWYSFGDFIGKQGYRTFRPIPQETVTIKRNEFGEIEPDGVWQAIEKMHVIVGSQDPTFFSKLPRDRFVLWSWITQWGSPLGVSLLRPAYRWYTIKDLLVQSWAKHVERFGIPHVDLEVPDSTTDTEMAALEAKLRNYMTGGVLVHRAGHKLTITPQGSQAPPTYQELLAVCDRGIARSILTPATLFDQPDTGAYSLGQSQLTTWSAIQENLGDSLADRVVMEQIIRPLVEHNYGANVSLPRFAFKPFSQPDLVNLVTAATTLANGGFPVSQKWIEKNTGIVAAQAGEQSLGPSTAQGPFDQFPPSDQQGDDGLGDLQRALMERAHGIASGNGNGGGR